MAPGLDALSALGSSVPLAVLGAVLLGLRPRRNDATFFGAFLVVWAAQSGIANLTQIPGGSASWYAGGLLLSLALVALTSLLLVHYATLVRPLRGAAVFVGTFAILAGAAVVAVAVAPERIVPAPTLDPETGLPSVQYAPLRFVLFTFPNNVAYFLAIAVLYVQYRRAPAGSPRHRVRASLLAFVLITGYRCADNLIYFLAPPDAQVGADGASQGMLQALFLGGTLFLAGILVHLLARPPAPENVDAGLALAFVAPAASAVLGRVALELRFDLGDFLLGFWRFAFVATVAHALARHQLFDLDLRLKRAAAPALAALALGFGAIGTGVLAITGAGAAGSLAPLAVGAVAAAGAWRLREGIADLLFPGVAAEPDYLRQRKIDVYRAFVERGLARPGARDDAAAERLRAELGLSDREGRVIEHVVRRGLPPLQSTGDAPVPGSLGAAAEGRYRIERLLGEGAAGRAYLALDRESGRRVVVKTADARGRWMLQREARTAARLKHPGVVRVLEEIEGPGGPALVLEYAEGGSVRDLLARRGGLPLADATRILDGILCALEAAHALGIVHRDVKPDNVLLAADGRAKLADFGVAVESAPSSGTATVVEAAGTLLYMSPEQVRGHGVDARSDLYAAAAVFHEMITGRSHLRIAGKDDFQVRRLIVTGEIDLAVRGEPPWVRALLARALATDPASRFGSAKEMREALPRVRGSDAIATSP